MLVINFKLPQIEKMSSNYFLNEITIIEQIGIFQLVEFMIISQFFLDFIDLINKIKILFFANVNVKAM